MKSKTIYNSMKNFAKKLGDENLTVSLAICENESYISVSCHSSKEFKFDHGGLQRTAKVDLEDMDRNINDVLGKLIDKYRKHLIPRDKENIDAS